MKILFAGGARNKEEKIMTIEIADRLVKLRKKYGYSQEELADKLGLSRQAVSKWERAEASPDTDNLICLAKLYGVSLDELLATDEDIDTIVKEQVKEDEEKKEDEKEENKEDTSNYSSGKKHDKVVINNDGIFVQDKDGSSVVIGKHGIHCYDSEHNCVKSHEPDRVMAVIGAVEGILFLLSAIAFILLGTLLNLWASAWIVFFLPEIICSIARCIRKKNGNMFNMAFLCCFVFFFVCMFLPALIQGMPQLWHPMWVVFILIPVYHSSISAIDKALGRDCHIECDDSNDEDDKDEVNVKADVDLTVENK